MKVLELFAGTRSIGRAFEERGHEVFSVDWDRQFDDIDWYGDVEFLTADMVLDMFGRPDVVWQSPDCTSYSVAAISTHRRREPDGNLRAITPYAEKCDRINWHLRKLMVDLDPKYWFFENPRGGMRKMDFMRGIPRYTITYCQYTLTDLPLESRRMKPTDIWTNHPDPKFKPPCKNGDPCHVRAPRGARTGTQGLSKVDRSRIPDELCRHIVEICEEEHDFVPKMADFGPWEPDLGQTTLF